MATSTGSRLPGASVDATDTDNVNEDLFVDLMMGVPLSLYVDQDVQDKDKICELIEKHGGVVHPTYSTVPYILVDPKKESGQSLYRQYAGKKGKVVLDANWVYACVREGELQTFKTDWAGCKVNGTERDNLVPETIQQTNPIDTQAPATAVTTRHPYRTPPSTSRPQTRSTRGKKQASATSFPPLPQEMQHDPQPPAAPHHPHARDPEDPTQGYPAPPHMLPPNAQLAHSDPHHRHLMSPWDSQPTAPYHQPQSIPPPAHYYQSYAPPPTGPAQVPPSVASEQSWRGSDDDPTNTSRHPNVVAASNPQEYYPSHQFVVHTQGPYAPIPVHPQGPGMPHPHQAFPGMPPHPYGPPHSTAGSSRTGFQDADESLHNGIEPENNEHIEEEEERGRPRTRKRKRAQPPAAPKNLVRPLLPHPVRSPTPPSRVVKSTYGGNLFTAEDVEYLRKYIEWCVGMGLMLSLREICERLAVKAPHHTFYSWRRYCNKHQIRLGAYTMGTPPPDNGTQDESTQGNMQDGDRPLHELDEDEEDEVNAAALLRDLAVPREGLLPPEAHGSTHPSQMQPRAGPSGSRGWNRSPTPPKVLFRSTTGKGIAFTDGDVTYLIKYLAFRRRETPELNMVQFWKDIAERAPHHSRASWMKYWRRHRHELEPTLAVLAQSLSNAPATQIHQIQIQMPPVPSGPPPKRQRYGREDNILLAKYFAGSPEGTSDAVFQAFAREHPHHPWKGWQEHHRLHKAEIEHLVKEIQRGVEIA